MQASQLLIPERKLEPTDESPWPWPRDSTDAGVEERTNPDRYGCKVEVVDNGLLTLKVKGYSTRKAGSWSLLAGTSVAVGVLILLLIAPLPGLIVMFLSLPLTVLAIVRDPNRRASLRKYNHLEVDAWGVRYWIDGKLKRAFDWDQVNSVDYYKGARSTRGLYLKLRSGTFSLHNNTDLRTYQVGEIYTFMKTICRLRGIPTTDNVGFGRCHPRIRTRLEQEVRSPLAV